MKLNLKSLFRAALQVGGAVVGTGVIHAPASNTVNQILGYGAVIYGILWGQVNANKQAAAENAAQGFVNTNLK